MNRTQAMAKCNPQAIPYDAPKVDNGNHQKAASYDESLGFVSSCRGVSCLAHYSLMPSDDTVSRRACARELLRELQIIIDLNLVEGMVEVFVNRHEEDHASALHLIDDRIFKLLNRWEMEWQRKLGDADKEMFELTEVD